MGFDLAWFSSLSSERLCIFFHLRGVIYIAFFVTSFSLPFSELSLVGLALDLVDQPSSFSATTLLVGSYDP